MQTQPAWLHPTEVQICFRTNLGELTPPPQTHKKQNKKDIKSVSSNELHFFVFHLHSASYLEAVSGRSGSPALICSFTASVDDVVVCIQSRGRPSHSPPVSRSAAASPRRVTLTCLRIHFPREVRRFLLLSPDLTSGLPLLNTSCFASRCELRGSPPLPPAVVNISVRADFTSSCIALSPGVL